MNPTAEAVLATASGEVGFFAPGPPRNSKYGAWYGINPGAFCAMFLSWCHAQVGQSHLVAASSSRGYASTVAGAAWFQTRGQWGHAPRIGAHVFFRFSGNRIHHVGIVVKVNPDGSIDTVEGNTSCTAGGDQRDGGAVCRKVRRSGIVGYGYPAYGPSNDDWRTHPLLRRGHDGQFVRHMQEFLIRAGHHPNGGADGQFGPSTQEHVTAYQQRRGLVADGICGPRTWERLHEG